MKTTKDPSPLATSDKEIAHLLASLEEDAPPRDAEAALVARLDAIEGSAPRPTPRWASLKSWAIAGGLLVIGALGVTVAMRDGPKRYDDSLVRAPAVAPPNPQTAPPPSNPTENDDRPAAPAPPPVAVQDLPAAPSSRTSASASAAVDKDSFREQLAILESARHALSQGKADESLSTLRRYDAKYPSGLFTTEARVVRIEALIASGQSESARALARQLIASDPHGAYADSRSLFPKTDDLDR